MTTTKNGQFCFLLDAYYKDFPDDKLMKNKENIDGASRNRPCFLAFEDKKVADILWLIPISSKYEKYKLLYDKKCAKYGKCNTIRFGKVLNRQAVFLIQNMCPVTAKYIKIYCDKNNAPIQIDSRIIEDIIKNAKEVLAKCERGTKLVFCDINSIYKSLVTQL